MNPMQDRRVQIAIGGVIALLLAFLLAVFMLRQPSKAPEAKLDANGKLQVDTVQTEAKVSQTKPLRCFVGGQYVGDFTVTDCASKNGVSAQALDVGLDPATGQVAGGAAGASLLQPLPAPSPAAGPTPAPPTAVASAGAGAAGECMRYGGGEWHVVGGSLSVNQCVRTLFDGRCVRVGDALYGRYGASTLRLLPGRVEISPDNRNFRTLTTQDQDCSIDAE